MLLLSSGGQLGTPWLRRVLPPPALRRLLLALGWVALASCGVTLGGAECLPAESLPRLVVKG